MGSAPRGGLLSVARVVIAGNERIVHGVEGFIFNDVRCLPIRLRQPPLIPFDLVAFFLHLDGVGDKVRVVFDDAAQYPRLRIIFDAALASTGFKYKVIDVPRRARVAGARV